MTLANASARDRLVLRLVVIPPRDCVYPLNHGRDGPTTTGRIVAGG